MTILSELAMLSRSARRERSVESISRMCSRQNFSRPCLGGVEVFQSFLRLREGGLRETF